MATNFGGDSAESAPVPFKTPGGCACIAMLPASYLFTSCGSCKAECAAGLSLPPLGAAPLPRSSRRPHRCTVRRLPPPAPSQPAPPLSTSSQPTAALPSPSEPSPKPLTPQASLHVMPPTHWIEVTGSVPCPLYSAPPPLTCACAAPCSPPPPPPSPPPPPPPPSPSPPRQARTWQMAVINSLGL